MNSDQILKQHWPILEVPTVTCFASSNEFKLLVFQLSYCGSGPVYITFAAVKQRLQLCEPYFRFRKLQSTSTFSINFYFSKKIHYKETYYFIKSGIHWRNIKVIIHSLQLIPLSSNVHKYI